LINKTYTRRDIRKFHYFLFGE